MGLALKCHFHALTHGFTCMQVSVEAGAARVHDTAKPHIQGAARKFHTTSVTGTHWGGSQAFHWNRPNFDSLSLDEHLLGVCGGHTADGCQVCELHTL